MELASRPPRTPSNLSDSLHQQLSMYALAAGVAGVGALAIALPAEARVIYTPVHQWINLFQQYNIDLNHDGQMDFTILAPSYCFEDLCQSSVVARSANGFQGVEGPRSSGGWDFAYALKAGSKIGSGMPFSAGDLAVNVGGQGHSCNGFPGSQWCNVKDRYLGLRFVIHGKTHYGWTRMSVLIGLKQYGFRALISGYAYETVPNKPITAGKTKGPDVITASDTLGGLAKGAVFHPKQVSVPKQH
jgi:hypothetical protein